MYADNDVKLKSFDVKNINLCLLENFSTLSNLYIHAIANPFRNLQRTMHITLICTLSLFLLVFHRRRRRLDFNVLVVELDVQYTSFYSFVDAHEP